MDTATKRGFLLARGWIQAVLLVTLFGFFVLGILAYNTYTGKPPIPSRVIDPGGRLLFTRADIMAGQGVSPHGREIEHQPDAWLQSELARFHRGMSLTLLLLASAWLVAEMFRHREPRELLFLGGVLAPMTLRGARLLSAFVASRRHAHEAAAGSQDWR